MASTKVKITILLLVGSMQVQAQTFGEWFSQNSTQRSYLLRQIGALFVYAGYVKQGYDISQHGLGTIGDWKGGERQLHDEYYQSLKKVNPAIAADPKVKAIAACLLAVPDLLDHLESSAYVSSVKQKVLAENGADQADLENLLVAGKLELTDDQRMQRLELIYRRTVDRLTFVRSFISQVGLLRQQQERSLYEVL